MQFEYPNFLWALIAIAIPIIIHLFNFRKYKTVYFSNVSFLKNIKKETKSKSQLRNILLLIARIFAIIFAVLAFAKPYIPKNKNSHSTKNNLVSIYIDNSFSMDAEGKYGVLLENAKKRAIDISNAYPTSTKFLLLTNNFELKHKRPVTKEQFTDLVSNIESTHIARTINQVIKKAYSIYSQSDTSANKKIYLISDFQEITLSDESIEAAKNINISIIKLENNRQNNLYIDTVWFESPGVYMGKRDKAFVKITNSSDINYTDIPLNLYVNDTLKSTVSFSVEPNKSTTLNVSIVQWYAGEQIARFEINDFPVTFDNNYYFNRTIRNKIKVLLINENNNNSFLDALYTNDINFEVKKNNINSLQYNTLTQYQLIILNQIKNISSGLSSALINFAKSGGQVVLIPEKEGNIETYNQLLNESNSLQFMEWQNEKGIVNKIDAQHSFFQESVKESKNAKLPTYSGFFAVKTDQLSSTKTLLYSESGKKLFFQIPVSDGNIFASALPISPKVTDFAYHPLFVALFYNIALQSYFSQNSSYRLKPNLMVKLKPDVQSINTISLQKIDNTEGELSKFVFQDGELRIFPNVNKLSSGSFYVSDKNENILGYLSTNYTRSESAMKFLTSTQVKNKLKSLGIKNIDQIKDNSELITNYINDKTAQNNLSWLMLWLLFIFLIIEMIIVYKFK